MRAWNFCSTFNMANWGSLQMSSNTLRPKDMESLVSLIPESVMRYNKLMMSLECRLCQLRLTTESCFAHLAAGFESKAHLKILKAWPSRFHLKMRSLAPNNIST